MKRIEDHGGEYYQIKDLIDDLKMYNPEAVIMTVDNNPIYKTAESADESIFYLYTFDKRKLKNTAILRDWKLTHDFTAKEEFYRLIGHIYNDSRNHYLDGQQIRTSKLLKIDFENMTAETMNSIYSLKDMDKTV